MDGVRMNIRPFLAADIPGGKKGAGVLRAKPNIKWDKDCGKEPARAAGRACISPPWLRPSVRCMRKAPPPSAATSTPRSRCAIGWYIREYEQQGADRATDGEGMVNRLADVLAARGMRDLAPRTLRQCRQFYAVYPLIWQTLSAKSPAALDAAVGAIAGVP